MADISSGRVMTRTGSHHKVPAGATCDDHPDRPAVHRVQGETDSFGCEYIDWCQECYDKYQQYLCDNPVSQRPTHDAYEYADADDYDEAREDERHYNECSSDFF